MSNPIPEIITPQTDTKEETKNNTSSSLLRSTKLYGLKTLRTDTAEVTKQGKISLINLAAKQNKVGTRIENSATSSYKKIILISIAILLLASLSALGWFIFSKQKSVSGPLNPPYPAPLIAAQKEETIIAENLDNFKTKINQANKQTYALGDLVYFAIKKSSSSTENYLNTENFLAMLGKGETNSLPLFLENQFFLGVISLTKNHPLLVFETKKDQYERMFGEMLKWEKTMPQDLSSIFNANFSGEKTSPFKDQLFKNNAIRIYDSGNGANLLYTIFNRKYIIITDSPEALEEIIRRFMLFKLSQSR
ncbi:MAG: hypothetical protein Q7R75_00755 [bacterium]|nr:hypothetical protein [bacterium]